MDLVHDRGSMDPVHESGPWTRSKEGVHGPLVHVLSSSHIATALYVLKFTKLRQKLQICKALNNFPLPFIHFFFQCLVVEYYPVSTIWLVISSSKMIQDSVQRDEKIFRVHFPFPCCSKKLTRVVKTSWANGFLFPFSFFSSDWQLSSLARACLRCQAATRDSVRRDEKKSSPFISRSLVVQRN